MKTAMREHLDKFDERIEDNSSMSTSSGSEQLPVQPIPRTTRVMDRAMKIKARSSTKKCVFCKQPGHHVGNCVEALEDRVKHVAVDCARGIHFPYLHGVWRCEWCQEHLYETDVRDLHPALWRTETDKEEAKWIKYMDPKLHV